LKKDLRLIATFFAALFLIAVTVNSFALAQTYTPPQIPNYNAPSSNNPANGITIPDQPSNPGAPNGPPDVSPTPTPQPDYTPIALVIVAVAVIAAGLVLWAVSQKRKTLPLPPPPN
jgi:hypothetical protein